MAQPDLILMSRKACCLCEDAEAVLQALAARGLCAFDVVDVDQDLQLAVRFGADVPVLLMGDRVLMQHRIQPEELIALLAGHGQTKPEQEHAA